MHPPPEVAHQQGGAFTRRQALDAGIPRSTILRRIARELWQPVTPRVYVVRGTLVTPLTRAWAGHLTSGGVVSHESAACLHGFGPEPPAVHVTVPGRIHVDEKGIVEHRVRITPVDVTHRGRLPVTTATRTVVDVLAGSDEGVARALLFRAIQQKWIDEAALREHIRRRSGMHGTKQLRRLADLLGTGAHSQAERLLHDVLATIPRLDWTANARVTAAGSTFVVDVLLARERVILEVDGRRFHSSAAQFSRDRERQNALVQAGWTVLRFTWLDLTERPGYVRDTVMAAVAVPSVAKAVRTEP